MARATAKAAREPLTPERIETAALDLIERDGLARFSTRKLAGELHCEAMSIYHYFPSKGHLMDALVDRVMGEDLTMLEPHGKDWRRRLEGAVREWRAMALKRPCFFGYLALHRLNTPKALAWLNGILGVLGDIGLPEEIAVRSFRSMGYYLMGGLIDETAGYSRGHSTVAPVPDEVMIASFPHVVAAGKWFHPDHREATFEFGLKVMLDGIEQKLDAAKLGAGDPERGATSSAV